jgi:ABC-type lipoprotein export system ATPase subunit
LEPRLFILLGNDTDRPGGEFRLNTVGFVFQDYHLFPLLTTAENVAIPLLLKKREWNVSMEDGKIVDVDEGRKSRRRPK